MTLIQRHLVGRMRKVLMRQLVLWHLIILIQMYPIQMVLIQRNSVAKRIVL